MQLQEHDHGFEISLYEAIHVRDLTRCLVDLFNALSRRVVNKLPNACHVMSSAEK